MENEVTESTHEILHQLSGNDLNDRITALPIFSCKKCNQFLIPPIRLVTGIGNICGKCTIPEEFAGGIHNSALEIVLQNLAIPCPNSLKGCKEKLDYFNVSIHVLSCLSRNYQCPLRFVTGCDWEGGVSELLDHNNSKHPESLLTANGDTFRLEINISKTNDTIKILQKDSDKFILHVKCDSETFKLYYLLYYIGSEERGREFAYSVEQTGCVGINSCSLQHGSYYKILNDSKFAFDIEEENALVVDLSLVKQLVREPYVATLIKISLKNSETEELDEKLLNFFECPVCNNFMKPPIFQCLSGHSLCNRCRPKLSQCPTCRIGFGNTRNYALEALSNGVKFPCIYRDLGCGTVLAVSDINKHELECKVKPYNCPFMEVSRCPWEGTYSAIVTHLRNTHAEKCKFTNYNKVSAGFSYESFFSDLYCMVINNDIFRVCHKRDMGNQNTYWAVQSVGPKGEAKNFKCEIGLLDVRNDNRKLIRTDLCQDLTNYDNMFNQCIMLPSNVVSWFTNNGEVTYYCRISKINN